MNIAILGAGSIANTMAATINQMKAAGNADAVLYAIASRDLNKAQAFAGEYGIEKAYGSYEELLMDDKVELVYIATPHSHHAHQIRMCIEAGKAVLCEKAFTANAAQAKSILSLARRKGVLVTEAIWTRYQPMRRMISRIVDSHPVGDPRFISANLFYKIDKKERLMDPALAGGALLDVGIYPLNFAEMVFGPADKVNAICTKTASGVDETDCIRLTWKDGRAALLTCGLRAVSDRRGVIYCTHGMIEIENINNPQSILIRDENYKVIHTTQCPEQLTGYEYEVQETIDCLKAGLLECPSMPHSETIRMMEMMDEIRRQCGISFPFE